VHRATVYNKPFFIDSSRNLFCDVYQHEYTIEAVRIQSDGRVDSSLVNREALLLLQADQEPWVDLLLGNAESVQQRELQKS